jgi:adenylate cyclase
VSSAAPFSLALPKWIRHPSTIGVGIGLVVFLAVAGLRLFGGLQATELAAYDFFLKLRPDAGWMEDRVVVILIDDEDIRRVGQWPLSDEILARTLKTLFDANPRAIGVDLYRDLPVEPGTDQFERLLTSTDRLVFVKKFGGRDAARVSPPRVLAGTEQVGFADLLIDPGGYVRRGLLFLDDGEEVGYSFALRLALPYLSSHGVTPAAGKPDPSHLRLGQVTFRPLEANDGGYAGADSAGYQILLDYKGGANPFRTFTLSDVLEGRIPSGALRDRIVLLGVAADSVKDFFMTPYGRRDKDAAGMPGVLIHAHSVSQLLRAGLEGEQPMRFIPDWMEYLAMLLWGLAGAGTALLVRALVPFSFIAALETLFLLGGTYAAFLAGWWLPIVPLAIVGISAAGLSIAYLSSHERTERRYLMDIFARQVSPDVAEEMWRERDKFLQGGRLEPRLLTASILFTDLHNFTPVAERLAPPDLMEWLNRYMDKMAGLVMSHGGVVDDFFGDAIKANFGVPIPRTDEAAINADARQAVRCALAMGAALERMNEEWAAEGLPRISMRVGISTGPVVAGCLGSTQRMKFTTLGDVVNTAARLETYGKDDPNITSEANICRVLISEETARRLGEAYDVEAVGSLKLKGKETQVAVYRLAGVRES